MDLNKKYSRLSKYFLAVCLCILTACTVSYKFNGSSINYDKVKTISFQNFPNRSAAFVWGPMESMFNTALQDKYMQQTRLNRFVREVTWNCRVKLRTTMLTIKG